MHALLVGSYFYKFWPGPITLLIIVRSGSFFSRPQSLRTAGVGIFHCRVGRRARRASISLRVALAYITQCHSPAANARGASRFSLPTSPLPTRFTATEEGARKSTCAAGTGCHWTRRFAYSPTTMAAHAILAYCASHHFVQMGPTRTPSGVVYPSSQKSATSSTSWWTLGAFLTRGARTLASERELSRAHACARGSAHLRPLRYVWHCCAARCTRSAPSLALAMFLSRCGPSRFSER